MSNLFGTITARPLTGATTAGIAALLALSIGAGALTCSPAVSVLGGIAATRLATSDQTSINSILWWMASVFGSTVSFGWSRIGSTGLKVALAAIAVLSALGAFATSTAATSEGGTKHLSCTSGNVCRAGPRQTGGSLNEGVCFSKCCGKSKVFEFGWHSNRLYPSDYTLRRFRVQWPNAVRLTTTDIYGGGVTYTAEPYYYYDIPASESGKYKMFKIDYGDGCTSWPELYDPAHPTQHLVGSNIYDGEDGVSAASGNTGSGLNYGFFMNDATNGFLERNCGLSQIHANGGTFQRLFSNEQSYSAPGQCDAVKSTGPDPLLELAPYDVSNPVIPGDASEFYINPAYGAQAYCSPGYEKTSYGTCKLMPVYGQDSQAISCSTKNTSAACQAAPNSVRMWDYV